MQLLFAASCVSGATVATEERPRMSQWADG